MLGNEGYFLALMLKVYIQNSSTDGAVAIGILYSGVSKKRLSAYMLVFAVSNEDMGTNVMCILPRIQREFKQSFNIKAKVQPYCLAFWGISTLG